MELKLETNQSRVGLQERPRLVLMKYAEGIRWGREREVAGGESAAAARPPLSR